jgi:DNA repair protein RecO (recombination protein O)
MPLRKDEALVLTKMAFGESDKIVRLFTLESGKVSAIAKGAGKSQKRFMNTLEPFNHIKIEYFEKQASGMVRIESADIVETNGGIETSLRKVCTAGFFTEFVERLTKDREKHPSLFHALKEVIAAVKEGELSFAEILFYQLVVLEALGYMPNFHSCVYCGKEVPEERKTLFSRERGGILCEVCARFLPCRTYQEGIIAKLASIRQRHPGQADPGFERQATDIMEGFIAFHLELHCKSYRILKSVMPRPGGSP